MKIRIIVASLLIAAFAFCLAGCVPAPAPVKVEKPQSVAEAAVEETVEAIEYAVTEELSAEKDAVLSLFNEITGVVRTSGNEAAMQAYLVAWAESNGLVAQQDACGNIIIDKAADAGHESAPKIILQAHLDYLDFSGQSAETFVVPTVTDNNGILTANTSFGASDGIGVAMILQTLVSDRCESGPLRAIFTSDGDNNQVGAAGLDPAMLDSDYLISFDGVNAYALGYGHTGSRVYTFSRKYELEKNKKNTCFTVSASGLKGGDSGLYVDSGNANAIRLVAECIEQVVNSEISVDISKFTGGGCQQVFSSSASATVCIDKDKVEAFTAAVNEYINHAKTMYAETEPDLSMELKQEETVPEKVLSQSDSSGLLNFLTLSVEGVNTLSAQTEGLVESSCTLSSVSVGDENIVITKYDRGYSAERFAQMENADTTLASMCGFTMSMDSEVPGWSTDANGKLLNNAVDIYGDLAGDKIFTSMLNTTMELGFFAQKKPSIDMLILGADINNVHSNLESADVSTLTDVLCLTYYLLGEWN